jgi:hypothetical protein
VLFLLSLEDHMEKKNTLTRILTIAGSTLVWLPVLAPVVFSIIRWIQVGDFMIDYLMPAELGLAVLIGAALLLWAALRARSHLKWIIWSIGIAILLLFGSQGVAVLTGLASGKIGQTGWQFVLTLGMIIGYDLAVILLGIGGLLMVRDLFRVKSDQ